MGREFRIQSALAPLFPYVPRMIGFCQDESVIGSDFYVMEKLDGTILRRELPWPLTDDEASTLCADALDVLVALHSVDVDGRAPSSPSSAAATGTSRGRSAAGSTASARRAPTTPATGPTSSRGSRRTSPRTWRSA